MKKTYTDNILTVIAILAPTIALAGAPSQPGGAYHINYLDSKYGRSATTVYTPQGEGGVNSISFHCDENIMRLEFNVDEMVDHRGAVDAYFEFPDGAKLKTNGGALDGVSIGNNKNSSGELRPTDRILEKISSQARMSVRIVGLLGSKNFNQSLSGASEAISLSRQWCLGDLKEESTSGNEKLWGSEQLRSGEVVSAAKETTENASNRNNISFTSKTRNYSLRALDDTEPSRIYALMRTKPATTTDHPTNSNKNFNKIEMTGPSSSGGAGLKVNNTAIIKSSENEWVSIPYTNSLDEEDELLLVGVYEGGNSCDTSRQLLVALKPDGKYYVSPVFGRCNPLIYHDGDTTYFVYAPNEYSAMEIFSLTNTPMIERKNAFSP